MSINTQRYRVSVTFEIEREVFPDDPKDAYMLAEQEGRVVASEVMGSTDCTIEDFKIVPVLGD